ncbi:MAG TPA: hypothetical protein VMV25_02550 [Steroidobacteraceae bacterium]|nr:hypothetical protein [Steroidobacteraceae bacterium]
MRTFVRARHLALVAAAAVVLAACASKRPPAQELIGQIESTVGATSADAAKYLPEQLQDVQDKLAHLQASFDNKDYTAVITGAPAVLASAQGLAAATAAKKTEVMQALNESWSKYAGSLPDEVAAIQHRLEFLAERANRKMARGIDLAAAKTGLADATSLWSKAQAAFATGNLDEAVGTAKKVEARVAKMAAQIKLKLPYAAP